jgi:hypothetical protein
MEQLQRKVLLGTSAAMRSTPSAAMEAIIGLPPLDLFALGEALKGESPDKRENERHMGWHELDSQQRGGKRTPADAG